MTIDMIASAIYNNVVSGLSGITSNPKISIEQLKDEVVAERHQLIKEYLIQGISSLDELYLAINCVPVDCEYMSKCTNAGKKALHFEIPPIVQLNGFPTVKYIGSIDREVPYRVYTTLAYKRHLHQRKGANKPFVYIDTAVNANGKYDCYIFNLNFVKCVSVVALFADPRKLEDEDCGVENDVFLDCGVLSNELIKRLTEKYVRWYRQLAMPITPNTQQPK